MFTHRPLILADLRAADVHGKFPNNFIKLFPSLPCPPVFIHGLREGQIAEFLWTFNHKGPRSAKKKDGLGLV